MSRVPVAILGATGMVGQRLVERLAGHPLFALAAVAASGRSAGRPYGEAAVWRLDGEVPPSVAAMPVCEATPEALPPGVRVVLSALDGAVAGPIERACIDAGLAVVTNASALRMDPAVPLVIPEVNPDHLALIDARPAGAGFAVANPNCCVIPLAMALAPLHARFGVEAVLTSTYQAVSGAGYPGESAWDMVGNVHPHTGSEEEKIAEETPRILGTIAAPAPFPVSARAVRVPTADGHMLAVHVRLRGNPPLDAVHEALATWPGHHPPLPSCARPPLTLTAQRGRPAPRFDAGHRGGMGVTLGRLEPCAVLGVKFFVLAHNTIRGAAGAALANAELLAVTGRLPA
jgi:aspartate-semialdehyde dehydrogenase